MPTLLPPGIQQIAFVGNQHRSARRTASAVRPPRCRPSNRCPPRRSAAADPSSASRLCRHPRVSASPFQFKTMIATFAALSWTTADNSIPKPHLPSSARCHSVPRRGGSAPFQRQARATPLPRKRQRRAMSRAVNATSGSAHRRNTTPAPCHVVIRKRKNVSRPARSPPKASAPAWSDRKRSQWWARFRSVRAAERTSKRSGIHRGVATHLAPGPASPRRAAVVV